MAITASIVGANFVTVMIDGCTRTIANDHTNYSKIREALKQRDYPTVERLIDVVGSVHNFAKGSISIRDGQVFYGDLEVRGSVVDRILQMVREDFDAQPMLKFLENLMQNPSKRAVDELYGFLEATRLPITDDGCFLAYKKVNNEYRDFYTGKMDNSVGQVLEMPRNQVDDNRDRTCSQGLHFCSLSYLPHYHGGQGRVVIVKINPADVVSIPSDYNNAKGRAWRYEVVGEYTAPERETQDYFTAPVYRAQAGTVAPVTRGNPSLQGYNDGRRAAAANEACDVGNCRDYRGADRDRYSAAFVKGFDSVKTRAAAQQDYWKGYGHGQDAAEEHSLVASDYVDTCPDEDVSLSFADGYRQGYADHYDPVWFDVGYNRGAHDADNGQQWNDSTPTVCDDPEEQKSFVDGYATGWRDSKLKRFR
jgi:hypothetical protein